MTSGEATVETHTCPAKAKAAPLSPKTSEIQGTLDQLKPMAFSMPCTGKGVKESQSR